MKYLKISFGIPLICFSVSTVALIIFAIIQSYIPYDLWLLFIFLGLFISGHIIPFLNEKLANIPEGSVASPASFFMGLIIMSASYSDINNLYLMVTGKVIDDIQLQDALKYKDHKFFKFSDFEVQSTTIGTSIEIHTSAQGGYQTNSSHFFVSPVVSHSVKPENTPIWIGWETSDESPTKKNLDRMLSKPHTYLVRKEGDLRYYHDAINQILNKNEYQNNDYILVEGILSPAQAIKDSIKSYVYFLILILGIWVAFAVYFFIHPL